MARTLNVDLDEPFEGARVRDGTGEIRFVRRPEGLVQLTGLAPMWTLTGEDDIDESPTGRWRQTYTLADADPESSGAGRLELVQAFNGSASVEGTYEEPPVEVNGKPAELWTWPEGGELVLVWRLGGHGLALVANEADFSVEALIELAESATLPD